MELLSDAAFKVFIWLCLHTERNGGRLTATAAEIARALGKAENHVRACLQELERHGVCILEAGSIQIGDRFWPYRRNSVALPHEAERYVAEVKGLFLERRCVQSSFTAADEKFAHSLHRRGVSLTQVERAILLGAARKHASFAQTGTGTPIRSLHYFTSLFDEVQENDAISYWKYVEDKVHTLEQNWSGFASTRQDATGCGNCGKGLKSETR
ncbi:MAG TPA: helix-turn-helix domain-containing protein [Terriglobales bacterium]|nr:helix-turn-helix domain-containing protein [Terriglobales bacterium]